MGSSGVLVVFVFTLEGDESTYSVVLGIRTEKEIMIRL